MIARLYGHHELFHREASSLPHLCELHARVRAAPSGLMPDRVTLPADDHIVAGPSQRAKRDLIGHRAGRKPERSFRAEQPRDSSLQLVDSRVLTELIVANRGDRHGGAHARRGTRDGV